MGKKYSEKKINKKNDVEKKHKMNFALLSTFKLNKN